MNQQTLCEAIRGRQLVKMRYGTDLAERTFAPYIVYRTKGLSLQVSGYQEHNPAKPLDKHEWRNFDLSDIRSLRRAEETFIPETSFDPFNKRYAAGIICHVKQNF